MKVHLGRNGVKLEGYTPCHFVCFTRANNLRDLIELCSWNEGCLMTAEDLVCSIEVSIHTSW